MQPERLDQEFDRWLGGDYRPHIERAVSAHLGRAWQVQRFVDKADEASHPAAVLADGDYAVFVKQDAGPLARDQLEQELAGLQHLTAQAGVLTPSPIGLFPVDDKVFFIMEAVRPVPRGPAQWRQMGRALAEIHQVKGTRFGLASHNYWGSLYQDNTPLDDWADFYRERRLLPRLRAATDSGNLPPAIEPQVETLSARLPDLCGPPVEPTLLHGDAHHNNFISTAAGAVLIDPAIYYGHPEIDLAFVDFFAPVPDELFQGYQELTPLDPGFQTRRKLWTVHAWLAMIEVDGPQHLAQLKAILQRYL